MRISASVVMMARHHNGRGRAIMSKTVDTASDAARVIVNPIGDEAVEAVEARAKEALGVIGSDFRNSFVFLGKSKSIADLRATDPNESVPEELGWLRLINRVWHNTGAMFFSALGNGIAHFGERPSRVIAAAAFVAFMLWSIGVMIG